MNYEVYGGFEIPREKKTRLGDFHKSFWMDVEDVQNACGCFIFSLRNGENIRPWYIGKAERQPFRRECFSPAQKFTYNQVLVKQRGTPLLFLLPRLTPKGKLCKPTKKRYNDIEFLETMLIGIAIKKNKDLMNVHKTKMLRESLLKDDSPCHLTKCSTLKRHGETASGKSLLACLPRCRLELKFRIKLRYELCSSRGGGGKWSSGLAPTSSYSEVQLYFPCSNPIIQKPSKGQRSGTPINPKPYSYAAKWR